MKFKSAFNWELLVNLSDFRVFFFFLVLLSLIIADLVLEYLCCLNIIACRDYKFKNYAAVYLLILDAVYHA